MAQVTEVPLNSGQDQGTDRILLGTDKLALAQNCRLARDGRLEVRPSFTALSTATYSTGVLTAYDVTNYAGRLVALGDQITPAAGRPTDLFEYNAARSKWRSTSGDDVAAATGQRLPQLTDVRSVGSLPDQADSVRAVAVAAGDGYVCAVIGRSGSVGSTVHVFDPATDQSLLIETVALKFPKVVFAGSTFWIFGVDASQNIASTAFAPATDETLPALTTRVSNAVTVVDFAMGNFGTGFGVAYATAASAIVFTYNSSGVQQATYTAFASDTRSVAVVGNAAGTLFSVARQAATAQYELSTFNAAGTPQSGPTALYGGAGGSGRRLGIGIRSATLFVVGVNELNSQALIQQVAQVGHGLTALQTYYDARPEVAPVIASGSVFAGFTDLTATNNERGTLHIAELDSFLPQAFLTPQAYDTITTGSNTICTAAVSGTKIYWPGVTQGQDTGNPGDKYRFQIYEAETRGTDRRQFAQVGGELLISGGLPLTYDGRGMVEQGFAERPAVAARTQGTTGSLTPLAKYTMVPLWEVYDGKGRLLRSQAGTPVEETLTGANDSIDWTITTPHSLRRHPAFRDQGFSLVVSAYRTEAGEGVFFLDAQTTLTTTAAPAEFVTLTSSQGDAFLIDNAVLYEQSQTPVSHVSPPPYRYVHAARERPFAAGLPETEAYVYGKLLFPGEPVEWASLNQLGFSGRVNQPITGVAAFETTGLVWTAQEVWQIPGRGPEHDGTGEFDAAAAVASPGGCSDWRSIIVAPPGAFFQMRLGMLMLLTRGGEVQWIGLPVQDTLALFPTIVGAVFVRALDQVVFACNNLAGTDAVFLVYDLIKQQWFVDTVGAAVSSISELGGRLVYVSGGTVFQQDAAIASGVGALPTMSVRMGSLRPFSALGYGDIVKLGLLATYLGDCTVDVQISYDDGQNWTRLGTQAVTAAAWTNPISGAAIVSGDPVTLIYTPAIRTVDRFALRVDITNSVNTGGLRLHVLSFEVEAQEGTARKPARDQR